MDKNSLSSISISLLILSLTVEPAYAIRTRGRIEFNAPTDNQVVAADVALKVDPINVIPNTNVTNVIVTDVTRVVSPIGPTAYTNTRTTREVGSTSPTMNNNMAKVPALSFFMHDIIGGSAPSERLVVGMIATPQMHGMPFSKPKKNVITKRGRGRVPPKLPLYGTITVMDNELTLGHELGISVVGKAQGFYVGSSLDGSSHTMVFSVLLYQEGNREKSDTISFFGVHRTATPESAIAVVGGTGEYEGAKGYGMIQTLHLPNQHTTDGLDTIFQIDIYFS